ncbi:MAG TPA: SpoIIE family protein phosphatase [Microthrixaceae bacterium]|jgi:sigma-B regulation protein RsbU (phosphoserine phosphatase)|nr:SpoIIE family protein phosphatase [Microthrixaceae bacterium]HQF93954.1 SpoIIE family protein phosphatase [Microthrixaceae bacterium]
MGSRKVVDRSLATVTLPGGLVPVVDALNDVVVVAELDGSILFANVATEALLGWSPAELVGRPLVDLVPERLRSAHLAGMSRFVEGGEPRLIGQPTRVPALRADGNEVAVELLLSMLPTSGGGGYVVATMRDVRQRVDLERDSTLIHHVLDVVSGSAGTPDAIGRLLAVVATTVGWDAAGLWEPDADRSSLRCEQVWFRPGLDASAMSDASSATAFVPGEGLPGRVWTEAAPAWVVDVSVDDNFPRATAAAAAGLRCGLAFPLVDAGKVVAVIELFRTSSTEAEPSLLATLGDLGTSLGGWLTRTRLQDAYDAISERERNVADVLRRTLLPPELPEIDGFEIAAAFQPGADSSVGGDFYDAFPLSDGGGNVAIAIGDVCGSGPEAAAVSGQVRHTFRALAMWATSPAGLMESLDSLLAATIHDGRFCTAVFAMLHVDYAGGVSGRLSAAGHPPPLVIRASGDVDVIELRGPLLGVLPDGRWVDADVGLAPGDTLVLYTDGVTEARDAEGRLFGEAGLRELCAELVGRRPAEIVATIRERALAHAGAITDDIAVLALAPA